MFQTSNDYLIQNLVRSFLQTSLDVHSILLEGLQIVIIIVVLIMILTAVNISHTFEFLTKKPESSTVCQNLTMNYM